MVPDYKHCSEWASASGTIDIKKTKAERKSKTITYGYAQESKYARKA